jgi:hypothetical protein
MRAAHRVATHYGQPYNIRPPYPILVLIGVPRVVAKRAIVEINGELGPRLQPHMTIVPHQAPGGFQW